MPETPEHADNTFAGLNGGRLRRGNPGGRPKIHAETVAAIRAGLPDIVKAAIDKAKKGDPKMIELCLHYGIGKPTDRVELSGPNGGPIEHAEATLDDHERRVLRDAINAAITAAESLAAPEAS